VLVGEKVTLELEISAVKTADACRLGDGRTVASR
jgi:hypothetical protein